MSGESERFEFLESRALALRAHDCTPPKRGIVDVEIGRGNVEIAAGQQSLEARRFRTRRQFVRRSYHCICTHRLLIPPLVRSAHKSKYTRTFPMLAAMIRAWVVFDLIAETGPHRARFFFR